MSELNQTIYTCAVIAAFFFGYTFGKAVAYRDIARRISMRKTDG